MKWHWFVVIAVGFAALSAACSTRDSGPGLATVPSSPAVAGGAVTLNAAQIAGRIQSAVDAKAGYTLLIEQTNFVLPQWGGADGATVTVQGQGNDYSATAVLRRTGDGNYSLVHLPGQTTFKRTTCDQWARIPGGGNSVLSPFAFAGTNRIGDGAGVKVEGGETIAMAVDGIGQVTISFDPATFLPEKLTSATATNNGKTLTWTFKDWLSQPDEVLQVTPAYERGPGGNPC